MTRRARYIDQRERLLLRRYKWSIKRWIYGRGTAGKTAKIGTAPDVVPPGPKQSPQGVSSNSYNAAYETRLLFPPAVVPHTFRPVGPRRPPRPFITWTPYATAIATNYHQRFRVLGFHRRRVATFPLHAKTVRRSKLDRQITGCNFFFFRNGCFADDDILGRHPNLTDIENGAPFPNTLWPEPLGY